jgi:plasmid stabilization system protein ParE
MIAETPGSIGHRRTEFGPDVRSFPVPPHIVFFRFAEDRAEIVRILHGRRELRPDMF